MAVRWVASTRVSGSFHQTRARHSNCTATIAAYGRTIGYIWRRTGFVLIITNTKIMYQNVSSPNARSLLPAWDRAALPATKLRPQPKPRTAMPTNSDQNPLSLTSLM